MAPLVKKARKMHEQGTINLATDRETAIYVIAMAKKLRSVDRDIKTLAVPIVKGPPMKSGKPQRMRFQLDRVEEYLESTEDVDNIKVPMEEN